MPKQTSTRAASIDRMAEVMREFMARAVLFQDAVARVGGINSTDMQAVGLLMSEGPATPGELAERTGLTAGGAITAVIDRLERAGYVTRERDVADRRRVIVTAVPETVLAKVGPIYGRVGRALGRVPRDPDRRPDRLRERAVRPRGGDQPRGDRGAAREG